MPSWMKLWIIIEVILFAWFIQQLTTNLFLLILLFVGLFLLVRKTKKDNRTKRKQVGFFFILFSVLATQAAWAMLFVAAVFLLFPFLRYDPSSIKINRTKPAWKQKEFFSVDALGSVQKSPQIRKNVWIGREHFGRNDYEWDDINFTKFMGETVIDLGNTLLSNKDNVIVIRKGFGNTKILVPGDVGISVNYSALLGKVIYDEEEMIVRNQHLKYVEETYNQKPRKLHIILNVLVGEIEVLSL